MDARALLAWADTQWEGAGDLKLEALSWAVATRIFEIVLLAPAFSGASSLTAIDLAPALVYHSSVPRPRLGKRHAPLLTHNSGPLFSFNSVNVTF